MKKATTWVKYVFGFFFIGALMSLVVFALALAWLIEMIPLEPLRFLIYAFIGVLLCVSICVFVVNSYE